MHFMRVLRKEYHVIEYIMSERECVGLVTLVGSLDHIYGKMPKLLEQYE